MCTFLRDRKYLKTKATPHLLLRTSPTAETVWHDVSAPIFTLFHFSAPLLRNFMIRARDAFTSLASWTAFF